MQNRGSKTKSTLLRDSKNNNIFQFVVRNTSVPSEAANSLAGVSCFFWLAQAASLGAIAILFSFLFSSCQSPDRVPMRGDYSARSAPTCLAAGDLLKLTYPGAPEFNQAQKIRPDGRLSLPLIGEVEAAGLSIGEFQGKLARMYKSQLENTEVVVALENRAIPVYVCGAVNRPGKVVIDRPVSALEAIMEAGGFSETTADMSKVHLIRIENGRHVTRIINLKRALRAQQSTALYVRPYDVIYVPESLF